MSDTINTPQGVDVLRAHVYVGAGSSEFLISRSPQEIARFLMEHQTADKIIVTDILDRFVMSSFGCFVDQCVDRDLLIQIMAVLVPLQSGISSTDYEATLKGKGEVSLGAIETMVLVFREDENDFMCWELDVNPGLLDEAKTVEMCGSLEALMKEMPVRDSYDPEVLTVVRHMNGQYELESFETPKEFMSSYECDGTSYRGTMEEIAEDIKEFLGTIGF